MKILHYFLGFPPYRSGGMTKYAVDLMYSQAEQGDMVNALWPGTMLSAGGEIKIRKRKSVKGVHSYELINPLPVPLDEGIKAVQAFMTPCDRQIYQEFLNHLKPDVIHVHTLMGLHRELLDVASELQIRLVFTSHDYFGICPKVNLFRQGQVCMNDHNCADCAKCCESALSLKKIWVLQSPLYRRMKNSSFVKVMRKKHRNAFFTENTFKPDMVVSEKQAAQYQSLRKYYLEMLQMMDQIHFNSTVTHEVYCRYFTPKNAVIKSITHNDIRDNRKENKWEPRDVLRLTMLSPAKPLKGFQLIQTALDGLWESGKRDFELRLFSPVIKPSPYMIIREDGYRYEELGEILQNTDVLLAPSVGYETFGFTALEALSYCVPVIVSDRMGVKDIVKGGGYVLEAGNITQLREMVASLTPNVIRNMRENIEHDGEIKLWEQHTLEIYALYK